MKKRLVTMLLCVAMACSTAACGDSKQNTTESQQLSEYVYVPEYSTWDIEKAENDWINTYGIQDGKVLGMRQGYNQESETSIQDILIYDINEGKTTTISVADEMENQSINTFCVLEDGSILACVSTYNYNAETQVSEETYEFQKIDASGQVTERIDITPIAQKMKETYGYFYVQNLQVDQDGYMYMSFEQSVFLLNPDGTTYAEIELSNWCNGMGKMPSGEVYVLYYGTEGVEFAVIDREQKAVGETYSLGNGVNGFFTVTEDMKVYCADSTAIRSKNLETGEEKELMKWLDVDINGQSVEGVSIIDENTLFTLERDWENNQDHFVKLVKTDRSQVVEKEIIDLVSLVAEGDMQREIVAFNKSNDKYRINLKTYIDYNNMTQADFENYQEYMSAATTRMMNDITGSNPPDIISLSSGGLSEETLVAKGILEELTPYLEEAGYSEDDFVEGVVNCYKIDDKLYSLPKSFSISTMMADSAIVGEREGWQLQDVVEVIKNMPEGMDFMEYETQQSFVSQCMINGYETFINEEEGTCNFDSDEFRAVLEISKTLPTEYDYDEEMPVTPIRIQEGSLLLMGAGFSQLEDVQIYDAYFGDKKPTYIGFPGVAGNGAVIYGQNGQYAICSKSDQKQEAAEFVVELLTKEREEGRFAYGLPVLQDEFDAYIEDQTTVKYVRDENGEILHDENGNPITESHMGSMGYGDWTYEYRQCTMEDAEKLKALINGAEAKYNYNSEVSNIILEELEPFFAGQKSIDEVVPIIQNRVSLFLAENN